MNKNLYIIYLKIKKYYNEKINVDEFKRNFPKVSSKNLLFQ